MYTKKQTNALQPIHRKSVPIIDNSSQIESLQRKADIANNAAQREETPRPNNTGMPDNLKSGIEILSGFSMDDVRVHYNSSKPATVQALAYTQGTDIHVAPGQEKHLPHEAWHVAQQMAGRVSPTTNINGMPVNDNAGLEHEADVMGERAVQCKGKRRKIEKKNPLNIVQYFTLDDKEFNTFGELREWLHENKYEYRINKYNPEIDDIIIWLHQKKLSKSTVYDEIEIHDLDSVESIIDRINVPFTLFAKINDLSNTLNSNLPNYQEIKDAFFTQKNIYTIIGKFFSHTTGASLQHAFTNLIRMSSPSIDTVFSTIQQCIRVTLEDIEYWAAKDAKNVENIDLTDSDVHCRGAGVCIITYKDNTQCVIKPEDKSLEKSIYGTDEDSLANKFGNIGTLNIQVSPNDNFHGSKVQYFEHADLGQIGKEKAFDETDEGSINDMLRFISILGLRDLHRENLVYSTLENRNKRQMQMIDAEIALDFSKKSPNEPNPFSLNTETYDGANPSITPDMRNRFEKKQIDINEYNRCIKLLDGAQKHFEGKKSRLLLIPTEDLYGYRSNAYENELDDFSKKFQNMYCDSIKTKLQSLLRGISLDNISLCITPEELIKKTYFFFISGRIPYFEYEFDSGIIYQKMTDTDPIELYQSGSLRLKNVIERRKMILRIAFEKALTEQRSNLLNSLKDRITFQAPSQQSQSEDDSNSEWT